MRFNSVKRGNFSGLARGVNRSYDQVFKASRDTAVDNTAIAKASIQGRSAERRAAMQAEGQVARAGLQAFAEVKDTKNKIESAEKIADIKRPAKRMAGIVGGLGAIVGGYVGLEGSKKDKAERAELRTYREQLDAKADARDAASDKRDQEYIDFIKSTGNGGGGSSEPKPSAPVSQQSASKPTSGSLVATQGSPSKPSGGGGIVAPIATPVTPKVSKMYRNSKEGSTGMQYMNSLVSSGMSATQAAALVGHLEVESDNFRAFEEYAPNAYGTKGAGVLQWTDIPGGSKRRTEFINWSKNQGLSPTSFEANSGYLLHEMKHGNHWTGGGNLQDFKGISNLQNASRYLESNYIRPSAGSSDRRLQAGQRYLNQWNSK